MVWLVTQWQKRRMRLNRLFILGFYSFLLMGCKNPSRSNETSNSGIPKIEVSPKVHDFGQVNEGEEVGATFWAKNNGTGALIISNVKAGCGCTSVKWTQEPVAVGDSARIDVLFNTKARSGQQTKEVTVYSNSPESPDKLLIIAFVK